MGMNALHTDIEPARTTPGRSPASTWACSGRQDGGACSNNPVFDDPIQIVLA
jgi:hypothetical protein